MWCIHMYIYWMGTVRCCVAVGEGEKFRRFVFSYIKYSRFFNLCASSTEVTLMVDNFEDDESLLL